MCTRIYMDNFQNNSRVYEIDEYLNNYKLVMAQFHISELLLIINKTREKRLI